MALNGNRACGQELRLQKMEQARIIGKGKTTLMGWFDRIKLCE